jgi:lipopolysaccharide biosynthesis protein
MRLIAFYLPQYHEIPENNEFWGKGFTEWTNIKRATPLFESHHQPRLPTELGFYDLNDDNIRHQQAKLAQEYGIDAWCYYYYRFGNKKVLEMPLNKHINDKNLKMPFLICWANENWTRTWDGGDKEILLQQNHNYDDDLNFIKDVCPMFLDDRYLRINNKPVLLIYRTELWKNIKNTVEIWRQYALENFGLELYLIRCHGFDLETSPTDINFDAAYQFPPFDMCKKLVRFKKDCETGGVCIYKTWPRMVNMEKTFKLFRGVMPYFDNTPRRKERGHLFFGGSPENYQKWLESAIKYTINNFKNDERIIFINAWNEWAEGAILEPCNQWGKKYLESTLKARNNIKTYEN